MPTKQRLVSRSKASGGERAKRRTVRLRDLIRFSGKPIAHTLWLPPEQNPDFMLQVQENRVLSVHQLPGVSHKDFGVIGFLREPGILYFVFPKPLAYAEGVRVIGIDYGLLGQRTGNAGLRKHTVRHRRKPAIGSLKRA